MPDIIPVILCGGSGTRLWPLSRELCPKQFVDFGEKPTLFAQAMRRMQSLPGCKRAVVVCNEAHRFHALHGLQACGLQADVLLEPEPRNTAPAIAVASLFLREWEEDPLMLVLPADQLEHAKAAYDGQGLFPRGGTLDRYGRRLPVCHGHNHAHRNGAIPPVRTFSQ